MRQQCILSLWFSTCVFWERTFSPWVSNRTTRHGVASMKQPGCFTLIRAREAHRTNAPEPTSRSPSLSATESVAHIQCYSSSSTLTFCGVIADPDGEFECPGLLGRAGYGTCEGVEGQSLGQRARIYRPVVSWDASDDIHSMRIEGPHASLGQRLVR